jgi:hypothetical protein
MTHLSGLVVKDVDDACVLVVRTLVEIRSKTGPESRFHQQDRHDFLVFEVRFTLHSVRSLC